MREGQTLFTYLHLAADKRAAPRRWSTRKVTGIAYETVELPDRSLPLLAPMSEVAGRLAPQVGAHTLMRAEGGRGVLMGGVSGVYAAKVVVIGAGVSGHERRRDRARHAGRGAAAGHATSTGCARSTGSTRATCRPSRPTPTRSSGPCLDADLVIGAVLVPGAKAPEAGHQRAGLADEAGLGARRHLDRPGRLLRGLPPDHARRPDLQGARLGLLLRREHARRGAAHLDLRADQRHAAVRRGAGRQGLAARRCGDDHALALGLNTHDGHGHLRAGRRGARLRVPSLDEVLG